MARKIAHKIKWWIDLVYMNLGFKKLFHSRSLQSTEPPYCSDVWCTTCVYAYIPVSIKVGDQITSILPNGVLYERLETYTRVQIYHAFILSNLIYL